jgi:hypothetical protein
VKFSFLFPIRYFHQSFKKEQILNTVKDKNKKPFEVSLREIIKFCSSFETNFLIIFVLAISAIPLGEENVLNFTLK